MSVNNRNSLKTTVSAVASAGLGALTISTAVTGNRSFVSGDNGLTFDRIRIEEAGVGWELRNGCVYTHSGTSLSRGTLVDSSSGSAIAFSTAAIVSQVLDAVMATNLDRLWSSGFSARANGTNTQNLTTGVGTTLISGSGGALRSVDWNINSYFDTTSGIFFPLEAGIWLIGASAVIDSMSDGTYMAVYISHSTDGSSWSDSDSKGVIAWRGASSAAALVIGGSGSGIVESNGTTDRWALRVFHNDVGTPKVPGTASVIGWCRFWAKRLGATS